MMKHDKVEWKMEAPFRKGLSYSEISDRGMTLDVNFTLYITWETL